MRFWSKRVQVIKESLRSGWLAICLASFLVLPGCASYHVTIPDSDPVRSEGQTAEYQSKTMHAFFWGLLLQPQVLSAECQGQGINDVVVFRTWLHDYVGVITLGIWMPTQVRFRCKAPPTRPGILPGARKRSRGIT